MLLLFAFPIIAAVAVAYRYLQLYAPTNVMVRRVRGDEPRLSTAAALVVVASALMVAMHATAREVANGAPAWLNVMVLVLAWDAIKIGWLAIALLIRRISLGVWRILGPPRRAVIRQL